VPPQGTRRNLRRVMHREMHLATQNELGGVLDQWLLDATLNLPVNGRISRARYRVFRLIRKLRLAFSDPLVAFSLDGYSLRVPLSHELPFYRRTFPEYASNLGKIGSCVAHKYPDLPIIDVGANVGDSAAILRSACSRPILCIEGEPGFFRCLLQNTKSIPDLQLEKAFLGAEGDKVGVVSVHNGNAEISLGSGTGLTSICTLSEVLSRHPRFASAKFIKLDAEGFDCKIISSEREFLARNKPVLFFEYYPQACTRAGYNASAVFPVLATLGYSTILIYQNVGRYFLTINLDQLCSLEDLHCFVTDLCGFCDVVAFHHEDLDIASEIRASEYASRKKTIVSRESAIAP
jgi:FkbM family methyltransferase